MQWSLVLTLELILLPIWYTRCFPWDSQEGGNFVLQCYHIPPLTPPKEGFSLQEHAAAGRKREGFEVRFSVIEQPKQVLSITTEVAKYLCS